MDFSVSKISQHLDKHKFHYVILFSLIFLTLNCFVTPTRAANARPDSVQTFSEQNMSAAMILTLNVTVPEGDGVREGDSQLLKIRCPLMLERIDEGDSQAEGGTAANEAVTPTFVENKLYGIYNKSGEIKRAHTWKNATDNTEYVNYTDVSASSMSAVATTGYKYTGIVMSPEQMGFLATWLMGYTLNQVEGAYMEYETGTGQRVEYFIEERTVNMTTDTDLSDGVINAVPEEADFSGEVEKRVTNFGFEVIDENEEAVAPLIVLGIIIAIAIIAVAAASIVHDLTGHAAQEELAAAYEQGYKAGADDQAMTDKNTIWQLFNNGNITKEQANILLNEVNINNDNVKSNFTNPYDLGSYNKWSSIIVMVMSVVTFIIIIIIIIIAIVIFWRWYSGKKKGKENKDIIIVQESGVKNV
ncbi:MAG: hypothetical protein ACTSYF_01050 [Promethearchaeota archaeon]